MKTKQEILQKPSRLFAKKRNDRTSSQPPISPINASVAKSNKGDDENDEADFMSEEERKAVAPINND